MYYLFFAFPLLIYFELLGRLFFLYIKKKQLEFNFIIGFCLLIAFLYITGWPISVYGLASIYYVILVSIFGLISLILIIKNIKKLDFNINIKLWIIFILFLILSIIISFYRTLGDPHGFDSLFYINFIGYNVDTPSLNGVHPLFGSAPNTYYDKTITYAFQSYNYFVSSFIYVIKCLGNLININVETLPSFVWTFQIILSAFFIGSSIEVIRNIKSNNKIFNIAAFTLLVLFMGNFYYNNCFGFIGNSYRMPIHTMSTIYLLNYLNNKDKKDLFIFVMLMLSLCGFSSTGTFAFVFIMFAIFFVTVDKEENIIKYICLSLFFPTLNILFIKFNTSIITILITLVGFVIIYLLNNLIISLFRKKYIKQTAIIIICLTLISISMFIHTKDNNYLKYFFDNYSEYQDMSWDYFMFSDIRHYIFNLLILIPLAHYLIKNRKSSIAMIIIILIMTVFNPLSANFMNKINWVYYRTYDLIINQYTIVLFMSFFIDDLKLNKIMPILVLCLSLVLAFIQVPRYYHYQFKPDEDYNPYYKIENKELEMIWNLQKLIKEKNIKNPRIANSTFYINTFIDNSQCLIGKEKLFNYTDKNPNNHGLYTITYPKDGWDNFMPQNINYDESLNYVKGCDYDIIVVDYENYLDFKGEYLSLSQLLEKGGYKKSEYSTNYYAIFLLNQ